MQSRQFVKMLFVVCPGICYICAQVFVGEEGGEMFRNRKVVRLYQKWRVNIIITENI